MLTIQDFSYFQIFQIFQNFQIFQIFQIYFSKLMIGIIWGLLSIKDDPQLSDILLRWAWTQLCESKTVLHFENVWEFLQIFFESMLAQDQTTWCIFFWIFVKFYWRTKPWTTNGCGSSIFTSDSEPVDSSNLWRKTNKPTLGKLRTIKIIQIFTNIQLWNLIPKPWFWKRPLVFSFRNR